MNTAAQYLAQMQALTRDYRNAMQEAHSYKNDHLTAEGLQAKRAQLIQQAGAAHRGKVDQLRASMKTESDQLRAHALQSIPKAEGSTRDSWERVRMLLDAGQSLPQVIAKADAGSLHAIREWAPTYLDAKTNGARTDLAPFERSLTERWAEISPNPEPIREFLDSASDVATFEHMASSLSDRIEGRAPAFGSLTDAFAAQFAGQSAKFNLTTETQPLGASR
jgi:hypothetical protein